jgi:hypothetical protein
VHSKNLFLRDKKGAPFLVVASEDAAIELKSLHRVLGASGRFSVGSADLLRETLGVEPGSVTPFAAINDKAGRVTVVLDAAMRWRTRCSTFSRCRIPAQRRSPGRAWSSSWKRIHPNLVVADPFEDEGDLLGGRNDEVLVSSMERPAQSS